MKKKKSYGFILASLRVLAERKLLGLNCPLREISGGHIGGPKLSINMATPYKALQNVSANNPETVGHKDLRFGEIVYILVFYNFSLSLLFSS